MQDPNEQQRKRLVQYARLLSDALTLLQGVREDMAQDGLCEAEQALGTALLALEEAWAEASQEQAQLLIEASGGAPGARDFAGWQNGGPAGPRALGGDGGPHTAGGEDEA